MAERRRKRNTDTIGSDDVSGSDVSLDGGRRKSITVSIIFWPGSAIEILHETDKQDGINFVETLNA